LDEIRAHTLRSADRDFLDEEHGRETVTAILRVLNQYVPEGERQDIKSNLPKPLAELFG